MDVHFMNSHAAPEPGCADVEDALALMPLGELSADEETAVRTHAATCARCRSRLAEYDMLVESLRGAPGRRVSRPLFSLEDIITTANLSDGDDESDESASDTTAPPDVRFTYLPRRRRFATRFARLGALAAVLLVALLARELFQLRGAPNSMTRTLKGGGTLTEFALPESLQRPVFITAGADGNLWFTATGKIGRITPRGTITEFPLGVDGDPAGLAAGPDKSLFVIVGNEILRVNMTGRVTRVPLPASIDHPITSIVTAPDGTIWFAESSKNPYATTSPLEGTVIGRISPQGTVATYPVEPSIPGITISVVAARPDGGVWIATDEALGSMSLDGKITRYNVSSVMQVKASYATDPDGNLWIVGGFYPGGGDAGIVTRVAPNGSTQFWSFSQVLPEGDSNSVIASMGREGYVWAPGKATLLRITLQGGITALEIPDDFTIGSMFVDKSNDLWFTEIDANKIGRIHLGA
jgi:streptogramin lyase